MLQQLREQMADRAHNPNSSKLLGVEKKRANKSKPKVKDIDKIMLDVSERLGRFGETNLNTLCSKCPFFQFAPRIRRKNARKRCRIEPQRPLHFYKCNDFPKARAFKKQ
jgi:hypothetical protein